MFPAVDKGFDDHQAWTQADGHQNTRQLLEYLSKDAWAYDPPLYFTWEGQDYLTHYLECDCLWTILITAANLDCSFLSLSASAKLGLMHPSEVRFKLLAGAFLVYHAIKSSHWDVVHLALSSGEFSHVHELMLRLASIHLKEVGLIDWSAACAPSEGAQTRHQTELCGENAENLVLAQNRFSMGSGVLRHSGADRRS